MTTLHDAAHHLHNQGISVVPVTADGTKRPATAWKQYTETRPTPEELQNWFHPTSTHGLGVITGHISGNLEMSEVEGRAAHQLANLTQLAHASGLGNLWDRLCTGWLEQSPSGGVHWFYRLQDQPPGNQKIARDTNKVVLAETRGENGFVVTAPSAGPVHETGGAWTILAGGPHTIPTLTTEEREAFHSILATLNEEPPTPEAPAAGSIFSGTWTPARTRDPNAGTSPLDDYEDRTDWADILKPEGWTLVYTHGHTRYWRRPGKNTGISASTGKADDRDRLYVFTSSTDFDQETPYTKQGAYAVLHHGGNHSAAASHLKKQGFGKEPERPVNTGDKWNTAPDAAEPENTTTPTATNGTNPATTAAPTQTPTDGTAALAPVTNLNHHRAATTTLDRSDDGNALALIDQYGDRLRYNHDTGRWYAWNGHVWEKQTNSGGQAREYAKNIARQLPTGDQAELNHKRRALSARGTSDMLAQAQTDPRITVGMADLDAHPWELNTPGGIINLKTGELLPPDPTKLHTRTTSCTPDPDADPTAWQDFLADTFPNNTELIDYMQRLTGYSAVGKVLDHVLPFAHGSGGNGKGVFLEAIVAVLGDYATSSPNGFLMSSNYAGHTTEIARLAGARMVLCSEVNEEDRFDEAKVKVLTGGDRLTARFMRQDDFTFTPTHHLWLAGNFQPAVESGGDSFWRRLRLVPFTHTVPEEKIVEDLQGILSTEHGPAVLAWIAQGAALFAADGLQEPDQVKAATQEYAASVDTVGRFLDDEAHTGPGAATMATKAQDVRNAYEEWCHQNGEKPVSVRSFANHLARHGIKTSKNVPRANDARRSRMYGGIGLIQHQADDDEPDEDDGRPDRSDLGLKW